MSTRCSIKYKEQADYDPGYHLYDDALDGMIGNKEPPVYLRLDGVEVDLETNGLHGVSVTVTIPRATARELGLLPPNAELTGASGAVAAKRPVE